MRCTVLPLLRSLCPRRKGTRTSVIFLSPLRSKERSVTCQKKKDCDGSKSFFGCCAIVVSGASQLWPLVLFVWRLSLLPGWGVRTFVAKMTIPSNSNLDILAWIVSKGSCVCLTVKACLRVWACGIGHCSSVKINGKLQKAWIKTSGCNAYILNVRQF